MRMVLTIGALALAGCNVETTGTVDDGTPPSASTRTADDINKIVSDAYASFGSGDAIQIMAHYAPNAVVFDAAHNLPSQERSTITKWTADFAALKPTDLTTYPRIVQSLDDDTIVSSGTAAFVADVGGNRQRVSVRYTHVFQRQADGKWLIVSEHNSIPPEPVVPGA